MRHPITGLCTIKAEGRDIGIVECNLMVEARGNTITGEGTLFALSGAVLDVASTLGDVVLYVGEERIALNVVSTSPDGTMNVRVVGYHPIWRLRADQKTSYVVSIFDTAAKLRRDVLSTTDKDEAEAMLADIGDKGRIETFEPRPRRK